MLRLVLGQLQTAGYEVGQVGLEVGVLLLHKPLANAQGNAQRLRLVVLLQTFKEQRAQLLDIQLNHRLRRGLQHVDEGLQVVDTVVGQLAAHLAHDGVKELLLVQELDHGKIQFWILGGNNVKAQGSGRA